MGWLSTYDQTISAKSGIDGKTLRDKFIEDGIIKQTDTGKWEFDSDKINKNSKSSTEFRYEAYHLNSNGSCFSDDGNSISFLAFSKNEANDFIDEQEEAVMNISNIYKGTPFYVHSSYCPGGCGLRTTAIDNYITNGEITDSKGKPCTGSIVVPKSYFSRAEDPDKVRYNFYQRDWKENVGYFDIPRSDFEVEDDNWVRLYEREESDGILPDVMHDCEVHMERDRQAAEDAMYGVESDFDDEYC